VDDRYVKVSFVWYKNLPHRKVEGGGVNRANNLFQSSYDDIIHKLTYWARLRTCHVTPGLSCMPRVSRKHALGRVINEAFLIVLIARLIEAISEASMPEPLKNGGSFLMQMIAPCSRYRLNRAL
jgi:hypothetical protein